MNCKSTQLVDSQEISSSAVKPYTAQLKMPFIHTLRNPLNTHKGWRRSLLEGSKDFLHHRKG